MPHNVDGPGRLSHTRRDSVYELEKGLNRDKTTSNVRHKNSDPLKQVANHSTLRSIPESVPECFHLAGCTGFGRLDFSVMNCGSYTPTALTNGTSPFEGHLYDLEALDVRKFSNGNSSYTHSEDDHLSGTSPTSVRSLIPAATKHAPPTLFHRMRHDKSILCLAIAGEYIFAGTQGGEILVYTLDTYERITTIEAHAGSVLGFCVSQDTTLLFSCAGDRIVNVWSTSTFHRIYSFYSLYDIGDVFCVSFSSAQVLYLGAQNTSIQWYDLKQKDKRPRPKPTSHPSYRQDRFFDSTGPGGVRTGRAERNGPRDAVGGQTLEIDKQHIKQFAHYGYVYCMLLAKGVGVVSDPQEEILISGGGDGIIKLWKLDPNGGAISEIDQLDDGRDEGISVLTLAIDGTFLYGGRLDGEIHVWDLETKQLVRSLKAYGDDVLTLAVSDGFLFSAGLGGNAKKFNPQYECVSKFKAHEGRILASAFIAHKGRHTIITGGNDNTIAIWDLGDCISGRDTVKRTSNEQLFESLKRFISYRTVSSDPKYRGDCRRGATYLKSVFKHFGAETESLATEEGYNPVILARFRGNPTTSKNRKKILFYGHYDVIAAENEQKKWLIDPFTMEGIDGYLYGRGVSDNKGPIMAAIYAASELKEQQQLESDIIFLIEGEEECGSRGFAKTIQAHKHLIGDVDWILLANSYWLDDHNPCLTYGLRGVIHATVNVESQHPDLHSGVDGSSLLDEALKDLVMLLSKLTGKHGRVQIPGFYDPLLALTKYEERLYEDIVQSLIQRNPELGDAAMLKESLMRRWRDPSLTIHRFQTSGPDNSTIIPRLASAALSIRLVPNQEADAVATSLLHFLETEFAKLESKNRLHATIDHRAEPWLGDINNQIYKTLDEAVTTVWNQEQPVHHRRKSSANAARALNGFTKLSPTESPTSPQATTPATSTTLANASIAAEDDDDEPTIATRQTLNPAKPLKPLYIREGGSIPSIRFLEKEFNAPAAQLPCGQASDSAHLDNERLRVVNLWKARDVFKFVFRELPRK